MDAFDPSLLRKPVPVFPLPDAVLLPGAMLPLHVFEPRYQKMIGDLLATPPHRRSVAIALLSGNYEEFYHTNHAPIRPTVGVGLIVQHLELPDGCYNILLAGRARARITSEDDSASYRRAMLEYMPTEPVDMLASVHAAIDEVRMLMRDIADLGVCDGELIERVLKATPSAAAMIDVGTFHLLGPQDAVVKQRILEEGRIEVRAEILAMQLRSMLDDWRIAQACPDGDPNWPPPPNPN